MATGGSPLVAAIHFGKNFSELAFSCKNDFLADATKVHSIEWVGSQLKCSKVTVPTCVLIQPDGTTIGSFGFEAETCYSELIEKGEHAKWFYFNKFKMMLWNKPVNKDTMLDDECGKSLPALRVFALSIRYIMDRLLNKIRRQFGGKWENEIHWVLTVPAICNDSAKKFMRLAAQEAGLEKEKLSIALEPETAITYCRHTTLFSEGMCGVSAFQSGKKYLVLDAGDDTVDVTVHEVCFGGSLKELHKATGGAWGGTMVDKAFLDFIEELIGKDAYNAFKDQHKEDFMDLLRDLERKKRETNFQSDGRVTMIIPGNMLELVNGKQGQPLKTVIQNSRHANNIELVRNKLRLDNGLFRKFFKESVDKIVQHISEILKTPVTEGVDTILMVGGYSESTLLQDAIKKEFQKMKIIVPSDAGLAVLKGAVMFGHCLTFIK